MLSTFYLMMICICSTTLNNNNLAGASQEIKTGTTIVALRYKEGIVVGADTRTSVGGYVSNRYSNKIEYLFRDSDENSFASPSSTIVLCRSGSAADTQFLADEARWELEFKELRWGIPPSVPQASQFLRNILTSSGGSNAFSASLIIAGYDNVEGRGQIHSLAQSGAIIEEDIYALGGSGSAFIYGLMDDHVKDRQLLEEKEAVDLVSKALQLAMERDGSSGGFARIIVINKNGSREVTMFPTHAIALGSLTTSKPTMIKGFAAPRALLSKDSK